MVKKEMRKSKKNSLDAKLQAWVAARQRHRLSHAHVQMARELGLNPAKLGKIDNHDQERERPSPGCRRRYPFQGLLAPTSWPWARRTRALFWVRVP